MKKELCFSKENKIMLGTGIALGILGGILGNFLVTSSFDIARNGYEIWNSSIYLASLLILIFLLYLSIKLIKINK